FARTMAMRCNCKLIEREREQDVDLAVVRKICRTARPERDYSAYENYHREVLLAQSIGASATFCGYLGDNLFEHAIGQCAATEYLWRYGLRPGFMRVAREAGRRSQASLWRVMTTAIRDRATVCRGPSWSEYLFGRGGRCSPSPHNRGLVSEDVLAWAEANALR